MTFGSSTDEPKYQGKSSLEILTAELSGVWVSELERVGTPSVPSEEVTVGVGNDARCGDEVTCFDDLRNSMFAMSFDVLNTFNLPGVDKLKCATDDGVAKKSALVSISFLADEFTYSEREADFGNNEDDINGTNSDDDNDDDNDDDDGCDGDKPNGEKGDPGNRDEPRNKDEDTNEDDGKDNEKDENDDDEVESEKGDIREDERDEDKEEEGDVARTDVDDMVIGKDEGDKEVEDKERGGEEEGKENEENNVDENKEEEDGDKRGK